MTQSLWGTFEIFFFSERLLGEVKSGFAGHGIEASYLNVPSPYLMATSPGPERHLIGLPFGYGRCEVAVRYGDGMSFLCQDLGMVGVATVTKEVS